MKKIYKIMMAAVLSFASVAANATVINFNDAPDTSALPLHNAMPYTMDGYQFSSSLGNAEYHNDIFQPLTGINTNGTAVLGWCAAFCGGAKTITLTGAAPFNLASIDVASLIAGSGSGTLLLTGFQVGGGVVTQSLNYADAWVTTGFANFMQLSRLEIFSGGLVDVAIDNLVLTPAAVPEPGALWLFVAALAVFLLHAFSRDKAASGRHRQGCR